MEPELDDQAEALFFIVFEYLFLQVLLIISFGCLKSIM
jgi:hypothetical protein